MQPRPPRDDENVPSWLGGDGMWWMQLLGKFIGVNASPLSLFLDYYYDLFDFYIPLHQSSNSSVCIICNIMMKII